MSEFMTVRQFGERLGVSRMTVYRLIQRRMVKAMQTKPRGKLLIPADEIKRLREQYL